MKFLFMVILLFVCMFILSGCATTTDPHHGGLFSYNPKAYKQRIQARNQQLSALQQQNNAMQAERSQLEREKNTKLKELEALKKEIAELNASTVALQKKIKKIKGVTAVQEQKRQRIIAELGTIKKAIKKTDDISDPEEQRLELERLQKKRNRLEKDISDLMLL